MNIFNDVRGLIKNKRNSARGKLNLNTEKAIDTSTTDVPTEWLKILVRRYIPIKCYCMKGNSL